MKQTTSNLKNNGSSVVAIVGIISATLIVLVLIGIYFFVGRQNADVKSDKVEDNKAYLGQQIVDNNQTTANSNNVEHNIIVDDDINNQNWHNKNSLETSEFQDRNFGIKFKYPKRYIITKNKDSEIYIFKSELDKKRNNPQYSISKMKKISKYITSGNYESINGKKYIKFIGEGNYSYIAKRKDAYYMFASAGQPIPESSDFKVLKNIISSVDFLN